MGIFANRHLMAIRDNILPEDWTPGIKKAEDAYTSAKAQLEKVENETAPELDNSKGDLGKHIDAVAEYDRIHALRLKVATSLVKTKKDELEEAWWTGYEHYEPKFAERFDAAAKAFTDHLATLDRDPEEIVKEHWTEEALAIGQLKGPLNYGVQIREHYRLIRHPQPAVYNDHYDKHSGTAWFPDVATEYELRRLSRQRDYWFTLANLPGVVIKWQTRAQQEAQPAPAKARASQAAAIRDGQATRTFLKGFNL